MEGALLLLGKRKREICEQLLRVWSSTTDIDIAENKRLDSELSKINAEISALENPPQSRTHFAGIPVFQIFENHC